MSCHIQNPCIDSQIDTHERSLEEITLQYWRHHDKIVTVHHYEYTLIFVTHIV